jgi:hypothetical protein
MTNDERSRGSGAELTSAQGRASKAENKLDTHRTAPSVSLGTVNDAKSKLSGRNAYRPLVLLLPILLVFIVWIYPSCRVIRSFDHLEENVAKVITPAELRNWATNLLSQYPTSASIKVSSLGTNFPAQLLDIAPQLGPSIFVYEADTNSPAYVTLYWGSGMLGARMIEVGPTNFAGNRGGKEWQPGIYFIAR